MKIIKIIALLLFSLNLNAQTVGISSNLSFVPTQRLDVDGNFSVRGFGLMNTITQAPNTLLTLSLPTIPANGMNGIFIDMSGLSGTRYGIDISSASSNARGFRYTNSSASNGPFYGVGTELTSTNIVSGYTSYRTGSGLSYGLYGITGTNATYASLNQNTWGLFSRGRAVISGESAPTSALGVDLEIRNTSVGAVPVTLQLRQSTNNLAVSAILGNINFSDNNNTILPQAQLQVMRPSITSLPISSTNLPTDIVFSNITDGSTTLTERIRIGTHIDFSSNNVVRGRLSSLGEFFIGTTNTVIVGDLMNGVGNVTFPWALNGYTTFNGSGVYGSVQSGTTTYAGVQGEYFGTSTSGAGVRGIAGSNSNIGVQGSKPTLGTGWGGLFQNDLGYTGFFGVASDRNIKKNIVKIENALDIVKRLSGVSYEHDLVKYNDLGLKSGINYGFIAQDVELVLPDIIRTKNIPHINSVIRGSKEVKEAELIKMINYIEIIPILVEAIKEQQIIIEYLKKKTGL